MKIATWNVNGIRAPDAQLHEFLDKEQPDILCLQEIKASTESPARTGLVLTDAAVFSNRDGQVLDSISPILGSVSRGSQVQFLPGAPLFFDLLEERDFPSRQIPSQPVGALQDSRRAKSSISVPCRYS